MLEMTTMVSFRTASYKYFMIKGKGQKITNIHYLSPYCYNFRAFLRICNIIICESRDDGL